MIAMNQYSVKSDFSGGYRIICKNDSVEWHSVARFDSEGGESFFNFVTEEQKHEIRNFAKNAGIL